jgi:hypothetical protein
MRTPIAATLTALTLALGLAACSPGEPERNTEELPVTETTAPPAVKPSAPAPKPSPVEKVDDPATAAKAVYDEFGGTYLGEDVTEEVSLGLCGQFESDSVGVAFRDLTVYGGYDATDAATALVVAAGVYCPEHRGAVEEWADAAEGMDDWAEQEGTLDQ